MLTTIVDFDPTQDQLQSSNNSAVHIASSSSLNVIGSGSNRTNIHNENIVSRGDELIDQIANQNDGFENRENNQRIL